MFKNKNYIFYNKNFLFGILIFSLCVIRVTYAYYAYKYENDSVIVGNVISVDAELTVELVVGSNDGLVPLLDDALYNALTGEGSENGACIDSNGNLSCQVYKITLTNKGSRLTDLKGTVELYASNSSSAYSNLKWRKLSDETTVEDGSIIKGMDTSVLVKNLTLESGEEAVFYIAVYLQETDADQLLTDYGDFGGTVTFETVGVTATGGLNDIIKEQAVLDTDIDFSAISSDTNGNGVYILSGTENNANPIYYYRGAVTNNNVIFADTCFKIVRTTETGGIKMIYNGVPDDDGACSASGTETTIGYNYFNSISTSPAYVGYMYGTVYTYSSKTMSSVTDTYYYGNDVTYEDGEYTLVDTISSSDWSSIYDEGLNDNHYRCSDGTSTTCTSVFYIYGTDSSTMHYMVLNNGVKIEKALRQMLDYNTTSSTIKGNSTTSGTIDYWYYTTIEQGGYSDYIEDTIYCNDRSKYSLGGWNPNGGSMASDLRFGTYSRAYASYFNFTDASTSPDLTCAREIDEFTVSSDNGNGDLMYPVGLLTADEAMLAGGSGGLSSSTYYLYIGYGWWLGSAIDFFSGENGCVSGVNYDGMLADAPGSSLVYVRPAITINPGTEISGGDGTSENPYVITTS